jgi:hypothetical protein
MSLFARSLDQERSMQWLKHILTGIDGETFDPARILWVLGVVSFLGFTGYEVWKTGHFDMVNFGVAYGGLLAAGAAGVRIKADTEPGPKV